MEDRSVKRDDACSRVIGMNRWLLRQQLRERAYLQAAITLGRMVQLRVLRWLIVGAFVAVAVM